MAPVRRAAAILGADSMDAKYPARLVSTAQLMFRDPGEAQRPIRQDAPNTADSHLLSKANQVAVLSSNLVQDLDNNSPEINADARDHVCFSASRFWRFDDGVQ